MSSLEKLEKIAADLSALTVIEAAELSKLLEDKWGVSAAAPVAMAAAPVAVADEKTEFDVILIGIGEKKLDVIKVVRELCPQFTLPQAKTLVESAPQKIRESVSKDEAEKAKKALEAAGAKVEVK